MNLLVMTLAAAVLTLLAVIGMVRLSGRVRVWFTVGMLALALTWFIPVILSILLMQAGLDALPWPTSAILNVVLYSAGAGLLLIAALSRDPR